MAAKTERGRSQIEVIGKTVLIYLVLWSHYVLLLGVERICGIWLLAVCSVLTWIKGPLKWEAK